MENKRITISFPIEIWKYFTDVAGQEKRSFQKQLIWYLEKNLTKEIKVIRDMLRKLK